MPDRNKVKPRRSYTSGAVPVVSGATPDLERHEIAINWADQTLFTRDGSDQLRSIPLGGGSSGGSLSGSVTIPGAGDSQYGNVSLLLHGNGNTSDSGPLALTGTATNVATNATAKFGSASLGFDGTSRLVYSTHNAGWDFPADFTVEAWIYLTAAIGSGANSEYVLASQWTAGGGYCWLWYLRNNGFATVVGSGSPAFAIEHYGVSLTANQWHHVAISRFGSTFSSYLNGSRFGTYSTSINMSGNGPLTIGDFSDQYRPFFGRIEEFRITKGARYTGDSYTVPTAAFPDSADLTLPVTITGSGGGGGSGLSWSSVPASATASGTAGQIAYDGDYLYVATAANTWERASLSTWAAPDPYFANVSLLLRGDGTGTTFVDSSSSPKTITAYGSATQSTSQSKWGGSSALLGGGTGNYLSVQNSSAFAFGSGDFVIEFWLYFTQTGTQFQLLSLAGNQSGGLTPLFIEKTASGTIAMSWSSNGSNWMTAGDGYAGGSTTLAASAWHHVALSRSSGTFRIYINGVLDFTDSSSSAAMQTGGDNPSIGVWPKYPGSGGPFYIDDLRVTKGTSRNYTSATITVPTAAFPTS